MFPYANILDNDGSILPNGLLQSHLRKNHFRVMQQEWVNHNEHDFQRA